MPSNKIAPQGYSLISHAQKRPGAAIASQAVVSCAIGHRKDAPNTAAARNSSLKPRVDKIVGSPFELYPARKAAHTPPEPQACNADRTVYSN